MVNHGPVMRLLALAMVAGMMVAAVVRHTDRKADAESAPETAAVQKVPSAEVAG